MSSTRYLAGDEPEYRVVEPGVTIALRCGAERLDEHQGDVVSHLERAEQLHEVGNEIDEAPQHRDDAGAIGNRLPDLPVIDCEHVRGVDRFTRIPVTTVERGEELDRAPHDVLMSSTLAGAVTVFELVERREEIRLAEHAHSREHARFVDFDQRDARRIGGAVRATSGVQADRHGPQSSPDPTASPRPWRRGRLHSR